MHEKKFIRKIQRTKSLYNFFKKGNQNFETKISAKNVNKVFDKQESNMKNFLMQNFVYLFSKSWQKKIGRNS